MSFHLAEKTVDDFRVGDLLSFSKTITEADVVMFAAVSGDVAPEHVNDQYAKTGPFGERIAHELLPASLASAALGRMLSPCSILESCEFRFAAPVHFGDTITATAEVKEKDPGVARIRLRVVCTNQRDEVVLEGSAVQVMVGRGK